MASGGQTLAKDGLAYEDMNLRPKVLRCLQSCHIPREELNWEATYLSEITHSMLQDTL